MIENELKAPSEALLYLRKLKFILQIVQTRRHVISGVSIEVSKAFSKEDQSKAAAPISAAIVSQQLQSALLSNPNSSARKAAFVNNNGGYYGYDAFAWAGGFRGGNNNSRGGNVNGVAAVRGRPNGRRSVIIDF